MGCLLNTIAEVNIEFELLFGNLVRKCGLFISNFRLLFRNLGFYSEIWFGNWIAYSEIWVAYSEIWVAHIMYVVI